MQNLSEFEKNRDFSVQIEWLQKANQDDLNQGIDELFDIAPCNSYIWCSKNLYRGVESRQKSGAARRVHNPAKNEIFIYRGVEQLVARRAHNPKVVGSSPAPATKKA